MKKRLITLSVILLAVITLALLFGAHYLFNFGIVSKKISNMPLSTHTNAFESETGERSGADVWDSDFMTQTAHKTLTLTSHDHLQLTGYLYENPSPNGRVVILYHGYSSRAISMGGFAKHYYNQGYHVFAADARGHGASEGGYIGMGWLERQDNLDWIALLNTRLGEDTGIVLHGISMGGATVMMLSGEALPDNVKVIVEDCGYTSVWDEFACQLNDMFGLPTFPILNLADIETRLVAGYGFTQASSLNQVKKATIPMLFIHGDKDDFVPAWMATPLYEACPTEKDLLIVEGAGHGEALSIAGDTYWKRVDTFIEPFLTN